MSQKRRILAALKLGPVCGTDMLRWRIPRYAARIYELRTEGHDIVSRPCRLHDHDSPQVVYELAEKDQLAFDFGLTVEEAGSNAVRRLRAVEDVSWTG